METDPNQDFTIRYDLLERLVKNSEKLEADKTFSMNVYWSVGFSNSPNTVISFLKAFKEIDTIISGGILKADKFETEFRSTSNLLPYNLMINGLIISIDSTMDEHLFTPVCERIHKEMKVFYKTGFPTTYYLTFVKKINIETSSFGPKNVIVNFVHEKEAKFIHPTVNYQNCELYKIAKHYFGIYVSFMLPVDNKHYDIHLEIDRYSIKSEGN
jgi:hypothetical protein